MPTTVKCITEVCIHGLGNRREARWIKVLYKGLTEIRTLNERGVEVKLEYRQKSIFKIQAGCVHVAIDIEKFDRTTVSSDFQGIVVEDCKAGANIVVLQNNDEKCPSAGNKDGIPQLGHSLFSNYRT